MRRPTINKTTPTIMVGSQRIKEYIPALLTKGFKLFPWYVNMDAPKNNIAIPNNIIQMPIIRVRVIACD